MQTKKKTISYLLVLLLAAAAIVAFFLLNKKKTLATDKPPVQYVTEIINNVYLPEHKLVSSFSAPETSGAIYLLGSAERTAALSDRLAEWDSFDNVDGRSIADGLKDFSGESICTLAAFSSKEELILSGQADSLRDYTVRVALSALDTLCYLSPYDPTGMGKKLSPKMLVIASPSMTQYGKYDIDSLFNALGCRIPVMSPTEISLSKVFAGKARGSRLTIGVMLPDNAAEKTSWQEYVAEQSVLAGLDTAKCITFTVPGEGDALTSFLDYYVESANTEALDALIIDDASVDTESIDSSLEHITSVMNAESLTYGNLLNKNFIIINTADCICKSIFNNMRTQNLFTHRVSQPKQYDYMLISTNNSLKGFKLMHFNERYFSTNN